MNQIPDAAVKLIQDFEGCRLTAYQDQRGIWTIGWGRTKGVYPGLTCTQEQANQWLLDTVNDVALFITHHVSAPLNDNQYGALISFTYNVGEGEFFGSTLHQMLEKRDYFGASSQFLRWDKIRTKTGEVITDIGLLRRRKAEQALFNKPVTKVFA